MSSASSFVLAYLVNSAWQTPLLLGAALIAARLLRQSSAAVTHRMWVATLWLQIILPAFSSVPDGWVSPVSPLTFREGSSDDVQVFWNQTNIASEWVHFPHWFGFLALCLYGAVTSIFLFRLIYGVSKASALAGRATAVRLTGDSAACWDRCISYFSVDGAQVRSLPNLFSPVTLDLGQPIIILPESLLHQVSPSVLQTVFAHELAHIKRRDFGKNLLNEIASLPLRYHPFFAFTRVYVVESREMVCDAAAADAAGGRQHYAHSLVSLARMLKQQQRVRLSHAIGLFDANSFERRITMLQNQNRLSSSTRNKLVATCFAMALVSSAAGLSFALKPAAPMATILEAGNPVRVSGEVMAGTAFKKVMPIYPPDAKQAKVQGAVVLHAVISQEGKIVDLSVVSGPEALRQSSLDAVKQWEYKPFLLNGAPVDVETTVTVNYSIGQ